MINTIDFYVAQNSIEQELYRLRSIKNVSLSKAALARVINQIDLLEKIQNSISEYYRYISARTDLDGVRED